MIQWRLDGTAVLQPVTLADAASLYACVERNRDRLQLWMPWTDGTRSVADVRAFIEHSTSAPAERPSAMECAILVDGVVQGMTGLNRISWPHRLANIGYWLDADHEGRGLVTRACTHLVNHAFSEWDLHRIEIRAASHNRPSRSVAQRLGAQHEGTLRGAECILGEFHDMAVYSLLAPQWERRDESSGHSTEAAP